jgi:hypothetical protein
VLPGADEEVEISQQNILHIHVNPTESFGVRRGDSETNPSTAPGAHAGLAARSSPRTRTWWLAVRTHPEAAHRHMIAVLDALQLARAERISLQMMD